MKVITINGTSHSGKTTVAETIIRGLRQRGYSVGTVKEIHSRGFTIDPDPSEDTGRHRLAGSQLVTARALTETDILYQSKLPMPEILRHYDQDYLILEGVADCNAARILTAHHPQEARERQDPLAIAVSGVVANEHAGELYGMPVFNALQDPQGLVDFVEERAFAPLPSFSEECCSQCGHSCRELAALIAWGKAKREDCALLSQAVELIIDGVSIPMVPFVQNILKNAILGVAQELRGYKKDTKIEVRLRA